MRTIARITATLLVFVLLCADADAGEVFTVTKTADTFDGTCDSDCSLREAITAARDGFFSENEVIVPAGVYTLTIVGADEDDNETGDLDIGKLMSSLKGAGIGKTIVQSAGADVGRVIHERGTVSVEGFTFRNGNASNETGDANAGGCVYANGTSGWKNIAVENCVADEGGGVMMSGTHGVENLTIENCTANVEGGGLQVNGDLCTWNPNFGYPISCAGGQPTPQWATNITLLNNDAPLGAGFYVEGSVSIRDLIVRDNTGTDGAGIYNEVGTLSLMDSEISENVASGNGGGINNQATIWYSTNVTVSGNTGAGIYQTGSINNSKHFTIAANSGLGIEDLSGGFTEFSSTIVANNTGGGCSAAMNSQGYNLDDDGSCSLGATGDQSNVADAGLAPLADYGGTNRTMALCSVPTVPYVSCAVASPALDTAQTSGCPATDQRGYDRPYGSGCDVGAYEGIPPGCCDCGNLLTCTEPVGADCGACEFVPLAACP